MHRGQICSADDRVLTKDFLNFQKSRVCGSAKKSAIAGPSLPGTKNTARVP
jgi:hypothetical protein